MINFNNKTQIFEDLKDISPALQIMAMYGDPLIIFYWYSIKGIKNEVRKVMVIFWKTNH